MRIWNSKIVIHITYMHPSDKERSLPVTVYSKLRSIETSKRSYKQKILKCEADRMFQKLLIEANSSETN
jgi:hypothetical protein